MRCHCRRVVLGLTLSALSACQSASPVPVKARALRSRTTAAWQAQLRVARTPRRLQPRNLFDDERLWGLEDDWEPALVAGDGQDFVCQLTTRYNPPGGGAGSPDPAIIFRRSIDGGATFGPDSFVHGVANGQYDPQIAASNDGVLHAAWIEGYVPGVQYSRSADSGSSWSAPIAVSQGPGPPNWSDKPILVVSEDGLDVYIAFNASNSWIVASHDGGSSFDAPVRTNGDGRYWFHSDGVVAPSGTVFFAATDYNQTYTGDAHVNVLGSPDGGASWTSTLVDTSRELPDCPWAPGCSFGFLGPSAALAVDSSGLLLLSYHAGDAAGAPQQMYLRTSIDGVSWSARIALSRAASGSHHVFPALATGVVPGEFYALWQDDRKGTNRWNTWLRTTINGGQTWAPEIRLSNLAAGAPYKSVEGYAFPYGDYTALSVAPNGTVHAAWGEGASWNGPGGIWFTRGH